MIELDLIVLYPYRELPRGSKPPKALEKEAELSVVLVAVMVWRIFRNRVASIKLFHVLMALFTVGHP
jgi:hypothetical protein